MSFCSGGGGGGDAPHSAAAVSAGWAPASPESPTEPLSEPVYCDPDPETKPVSVRACARSRNSSLCISI